jgi:hypothetical protein
VRHRLSKIISTTAPWSASLSTSCHSVAAFMPLQARRSGVFVSVGPRVCRAAPQTHYETPQLRAKEPSASSPSSR